MNRILVTGTTGNVGVAVIRYLLNSNQTVTAAARQFASSGPECVHFDFEQPVTSEAVFRDADRIFLLRPPHISNIDRVFQPLIDSLHESKSVFLSVQSVKTISMILHHKVESLIRESELDFSFIRPGYVMQNLTAILEDF